MWAALGQEKRRYARPLWAYLVLIIPFQVRCFIGGKTCCTVQRNDCRQSTVKKYAILFKRILSFAGRYRGLLTFARCLSGISALFIIGPFICVYFAARELIAVFLGDQLNGQALLNWGLFALGLELVGVVLYFLALLSSHIVAFHIQKNLQMAALRHLAHMPIGYFNANPSGKLRKIIDENSFQTETFIAHQLPDLTGAQVTLIAGVCLHSSRNSKCLPYRHERPKREI